MWFADRRPGAGWQRATRELAGPEANSWDDLDDHWERARAQLAPALGRPVPARAVALVRAALARRLRAARPLPAGGALRLVGGRDPGRGAGGAGAWVATYDSGEWDDPPGKLAAARRARADRALLRDGHEPFDPERDRTAFVSHLVESAPTRRRSGGRGAGGARGGDAGAGEGLGANDGSERRHSGVRPKSRKDPGRRSRGQGAGSPTLGGRLLSRDDQQRNRP